MGGKDQFLAKKSVFLKVGERWGFGGGMEQVKFQHGSGVVLFIKRSFQENRENGYVVF